MIPYFLSAGVHLLRDLTAARNALAAAHPGVEFRLGAPLGPHPLLDQFVEVRIDEIGRNVGSVTASAQENADRYRPMGDGMEGSR